MVLQCNKWHLIAYELYMIPWWVDGLMGSQWFVGTTYNK